MKDIEAIRANLDLLYTNADKAAIAEGYRACLARLPQDLTFDLHKQHVEAGNFEVLDVAPVKPGEPVNFPFVEGSPLAHGLVQLTPLDDGRLVKTVLELDELGIHAATAVELGWFEAAFSRARDN